MAVSGKLAISAISVVFCIEVYEVLRLGVTPVPGTHFKYVNATFTVNLFSSILVKGEQEI